MLLSHHPTDTQLHSCKEHHARTHVAPTIAFIFLLMRQSSSYSTGFEIMRVSISKLWKRLRVRVNWSVALKMHFKDEIWDLVLLSDWDHMEQAQKN